MSIAFYLHFCYSIPSTILYTLIVYVVIRDRKELKGPYYSILIFGFGLDVLSYISNFCTIWILSFSSLNSFFLDLSPTVLCILLYANKILLHAQNLRCVLSCFHRLSIIACPLTMEQHWERFTVPLLCLTPIWGAAVGSYSLFLEPRLIERGGAVFWEFGNYGSVIYSTLGMAAFYSFFTMGPNSITIRLLVLHRREQIAGKICRITIACTCIQLLNLIAMGSVGLSQWLDWGISQFMETNVLPFTRDAYTFCFPWCNFLINKDIRRRVLQILHIGERNKVGTVSATSSALGLGALPAKQKNTSLQTLTVSAAETSAAQFTINTVDMEKSIS